MNGLQQLEGILTGTGASVEYTSGVGALGRCDYENKIIYITEDEPYRKKIMILAHEAGHWLSFLDHGKNTSLRRNDREKLAYQYGWRLLANLGLARKLHITKQEWQDLNQLNYHNFDPDTKQAWT
jgi:hypothetical protein